MSMSFPLAKRYENFRDEVFHEGLAESELPPTAPMAELQLQRLWFSGEFGTQFMTTEGQRVEVVDFGIWNSSTGADFTDCTLLINGIKTSGDIELDPDVRDWERHGHAQSTEFNKVILHLFFHAPLETITYTRTLDNALVPQVHLSMQALKHPDSQRPVPTAKLGRCGAPLAKMTVEEIQSLLECAAQYRLQRKSARIHTLIAAQGRDQAIYQSLAGTLGYKHNQGSFQLLAQRLPLKVLLPLTDLEREALLIGVAGFIDDVLVDSAQQDTKGYLRQLWSQWWKRRGHYARWLEPTHRVRWKLSAVRPGNHPQRRTAALAAMLSQWDKISPMLNQPELWSRTEWTALATGLQHPYWNTHYTLLSNPSAMPIALLGDSRVQDMLANVVYPLLVPERPELWPEYLELPMSMDNQKVTRAKLRLFGEKTPLSEMFDKKLHHQQGLLQIYEDFCLEDDSACVECPFPERLQQWRIPAIYDASALPAVTPSASPLGQPEVPQN
jgi:hypothetical protein